MSDREPGGAAPPFVDLQLDRAHPARMYDYFLGGRTHYPADREAAAKVLDAFPAVLVTARRHW